MARILIIDDDHDFRATLAATLESLGHQVTMAADATEGLRRLDADGIDLAFLDYRMPGMDGLSLLRARRTDAAASPVPIIMLTAFASAQNTIDAMRLGAFDHLIKPIGRQEVASAVERALASVGSPPTEATSAAEDGEMLGASPAMRQVHKRIGLAAATDVPVLITGETGTGKEMVARALHRAGERAGQAFVAVNCAAIPPELLESELFGHQKGAFSGAIADRKGYFREADRGTLLLDEIGDMPLAMQAKLLRVLQEGEVTPVGSSRPVRVDVRIIAATHRFIEERIAAGEFRMDLFYRLNVLPIELLPLRERTEDIAVIARHVLDAAPSRRKVLSDAALARLERHPWPGNVRELRNLMERCRVLVPGPVVDVSDIEGMLPPAPSATPASEDLSLPDAIAELERRMIAQALANADGNRAEAARRLGIRRQLLYRKLVDYGLE
ncbi:sigma-54 dependent transcriptional regulator [Luteibacter aegosomatis]|uniref:sigma-54-dependent transcriptional regulator n=1 Tax=Luteibacter aegosomatis TaxID=2911537 RepID=UPI001FF747BE|nr:sigma-54 dependent transcriptional regulator [Luteibacter aegosomatis]UPG83848.1 sigma-54 dependent transcriptional regulator [Luteibacter aegosomatis]